MPINTHTILGLSAYYIASFLYRSLRTQCITHPLYCPHTPYLFAFWHGAQFLPVFTLRQQHRTPRAVLVSPSRDGDILSIWLEKLGYKVLRGSSRARNIQALTSMLRILKQGYSLGFAIDGPIGPPYQVKPGMTHMAQKLGIPIVPVGSAYRRSFRSEQSWDKYMLPYPGTKAACYLGEPLVIPKQALLGPYNQLLKEQIHAAQTQASCFVGE